MTIEEFAKTLKGNHRRFDSFAWFARPEDGEEWGIYHLNHRDSGLLSQSNSDVIRAALRPLNGRTAELQSFSHWAVGWVDAVAVRVFQKGASRRMRENPERYAPEQVFTAAFRRLYDLVERMEDYPILDEEDYSRREYEASIENFESEGRAILREGAPKDWAYEVHRYMWDHQEKYLRYIESSDDQGAWAPREVLAEVLKALGYLDAEWEEELLGAAA